MGSSAFLKGNLFFKDVLSDDKNQEEAKSPSKKQNIDPNDPDEEVQE